MIIYRDCCKITNFSFGDTTFPDSSINISALSNNYTENQVLCLDSDSNYQLSKIYTNLFNSNSISGSIISDRTIALNKII